MDETVDVVRAWKDEEYRNSLTPEQLAQLPPNPAGEVELDEEELNDVSGGTYNAYGTIRGPGLPGAGITRAINQPIIIKYG